MAATVYDTGFFDGQIPGSLSSANAVLRLLFEYYKPSSIVDVGCGLGSWLKCATELGVEDVQGIDGAYVDRSRLLIDENRFTAADLNERIETGRRFDLAISLEVAEHLSFHRSETFVADLVRLSDLVLFSAALPYQGGTNHINEQWLEFWAILFRRHGYVACDPLRQHLWRDAEVDFWYSQNLLVFCPEERALQLFPPDSIAKGRPLSYPHPLTFLANVARYRPFSAEARDLEFVDYTNLLQAYMAGETTMPLLRTLAARSSENTATPLFPDARTAISDVKCELRRRDTEIERLASALVARDEEGRQLSVRIERLDGQLATYETEYRRLMTELTAHAEASGRLGAEVVAQGEEIQRLITDLERQQASIGSLTADLTDWDSKLTRKTNDVRRLSNELAESNHALRALRGSWSWKLTAPLRFTLDVLFIIRRGKRRTEGGPTAVSRLAGLAQWLWRGRLVKASGLFDGQYYLQQNPDVIESRLNPLLHFFIFGAAEKRNPHPLFDVSYYLSQNPDIAKSGINPLLHYLCWGAYEDRNPHPHFDSGFYLTQNPDVRAARLNPLAHYMGPGVAEGRDPSVWFDTSEYLENNPEVALRGLNPLVHHLERQTSQVLAAAVPDPRNTVIRTRLRTEVARLGGPLLDSGYDSAPLVSVIIPCFNQGFFLEDAILSSVLASSSYPLEIIVVDDGSTDDSSVRAVDELAAQYKFKLVRQANTGLAGARNTGIEHARGKFVQFLDADDLLSARKIDIQVNEFHADPGVDVCVCEYEQCSLGGEERYRLQPSTIAGFAISREDFLLRWERGFSIPIHCALFRRELFDKTTFRRVTRAGKEDWIFWIELTSHAPRFHFNPEPLAVYRIHGNNTYAKPESMGLDFLRAAMYVLDQGLSDRDSFLEASVEHFRTAYLGSIKHVAIEWSRTHPV
jgi:glycosyltransferase involved in cell wall biosynthesis/SAM-dependent methyltransferase